MIDITTISGGDLVCIDALTPKAANVLSVQLGYLEYAPDFGIDLAFFLDEDFQFQNESFKSYLIQRLSEEHVNVAQVVDSLETFYLQFTFYVGDTETSSGGLIK